MKKLKSLLRGGRSDAKINISINEDDSNQESSQERLKKANSVVPALDIEVEEKKVSQSEKGVTTALVATHKHSKIVETKGTRKYANDHGSYIDVNDDEDTRRHTGRAEVSAYKDEDEDEDQSKSVSDNESEWRSQMTDDTEVISNRCINSSKPNKANKLHPIIHWEPEDLLTYLEPIDTQKHLIAHCTDYKRRKVPGKFVFDVKPNTILPAGNHVIKATFIAQNYHKYLSVEATRTITVKKKKPSITWEIEDNELIYGMPLSKEVFDCAFCDELPGGTFTFSHQVGAVLEIGLHTLTAEYEPAEEWRHNYRRGYAQLIIRSTGTWVPLLWALPPPESRELPKIEIVSRKPKEKRGSIVIAAKSKFKPKVVQTERDVAMEAARENIFLAFELALAESEAAALAADRAFVQAIIDELARPVHVVYPAGLHPELFCIRAPNFVAIAEKEAELAAEEEKGPHKPAEYLLNKSDITTTTTTRDNSRDNSSSNNNNTVMITGKGGQSNSLGDHLDHLIGGTSSKKKKKVYEGPDRFGKFGIPDIEGHFTFEQPEGTVLPVGIHTLEAIFHPADLFRFRDTPATVEVTVGKGLPVLVWPRPVSIHQGAPLDSYILQCSNVQQIPGQYIYTPPFGALLDKGWYILHVRFIPDDTDNWLPNELDIEFQVLPQKIPKLSWYSPAPLTHPAPLDRAQLKGSSSSANKGTWKYDPDFGTVLDAGLHTLTGTFYPEDPCTAITTITAEVEVMKGIARLLWNTPDSILEGEGLFDSILNCQVTNLPSTSGIFTYDPPRTTVLNGGEHKLKVRFEPKPEFANNFEGAEASVKLLIRERPKIQPRITWPGKKRHDGKPFEPNETYEQEDVDYPTPLNDRILSAMCTNVKGDFAYDPPMGTVLSAGHHVLTAQFVPRDMTKCLSATIRSEITVRKARVTIYWKPEEQTYYFGTPLMMGRHLNAKTDVMDIPGKFIYDTEAGTVLPCGDHELYVEFIPEDTVNLMPASACARVFVRRATPTVRWTYNTAAAQLTYPAYITTKDHLKAEIFNLLEYMEKEDPTKGAKKNTGADDEEEDEDEDDDDDDDNDNDDDDETDKEERKIVSEQHKEESVGANASGAGNQLLIAGCGVSAAISVPFIHNAVKEEAKLPLPPVGNNNNNNNSMNSCSSSSIGGTAVSAAALEEEEEEDGTGTGTAVATAVVGVNEEICRFNSPDANDVDSTTASVVTMNTIEKAEAAAQAVAEAAIAALAKQERKGKRKLERRERRKAEKEAIRKNREEARRKARLASGEEEEDVEGKDPEKGARSDGKPVVELTPPEGHFEYSHKVGDLLTAGEHVISCKFLPNNIVNYFGASGSITIKVLKGTPQVIWTPDLNGLVFESKLSAHNQCNATLAFNIKGGGTFVYDPPVGTALQAGKDFPFTCEYIPNDLDNYHSVKLYNKFDVERKAVILDWNPPKIMVHGEKLTEEHLCATLSPFHSTKATIEAMKTGVFEYDPPLGTILSASESHLLRVSFTPPPESSENYTTAFKTVTVQVLKKQPSIFWKPKRFNLNDGDPLTTLQLNAVAVFRQNAIKGTYTYNPPIDTVLPCGRHTLEVQFIASDQVNCRNASGTAAIEVNRRPPKISWEKDPVTGELKAVKKVN